MAHRMCGKIFPKANYSYSEKTGESSYRQTKDGGKHKAEDGVESQTSLGDTQV